MQIFRRPRRTPRPPRRERAQRFQWRTSASRSPYLVENPHREMAEARGALMTCRACNIWRTSSTFAFTRGELEVMAINAAHRHNIIHHPRRWLRSQHFQASIPAEVRERVAS